MAEQSLLCVNCGSAPPLHRRTWGRCMICVERNLPSTYYCGQECMNAHWPKHKAYHKAQKEGQAQASMGTLYAQDRSVADANARYAARTGNEYLKRFAAALDLTTEGDNHAAAKAWRKIIKEHPTDPSVCNNLPTAYNNLASVLVRSGRIEEAAPVSLKAMELCEEGTKAWAEAAAGVVEVLFTEECEDSPKPEWWNDEGLMALTARVVALAPDDMRACSMRAAVLSGNVIFRRMRGMRGRARTAVEIKEAATWFRRAADLSMVPAYKCNNEGWASECDEIADPLLAEEEATAAKARAAAETKAAKARDVAEAKAAKAAKKLLTEEEKEQQQAAARSSKESNAKGKGKKGKGKR